MFEFITRLIEMLGGLDSLVAPAVPFVVAFLKRVIDRMPKWTIPLLATGMGFLLQLVTALAANLPLNPVWGVVLGVIGIGLRELYDQTFEKRKAGRNVKS